MSIHIENDNVFQLNKGEKPSVILSQMPISIIYSRIKYKIKIYNLSIYKKFVFQKLKTSSDLT